MTSQELCLKSASRAGLGRLHGTDSLESHGIARDCARPSKVLRLPGEWGRGGGGFEVSSVFV